jgi:hypothetical protein
VITMSINLHLTAIRTLYTKKGKLIEETKQFDLIQTPTTVTNKILELSSFDEILDAYCDYVSKYDSYDKCLDDWHYIAVTSDKPYNIGDYYEENQNVSKICMILTPDNDMFEEYLHNGVGFDPNSEMKFLYKDLLCLGLLTIPHAEELRYIIKKMKEDEWEFEFYAM